MHTLSTEYYCGLPQELWNSIASEAEDLLVEEGIGNHLLGVYPAGNRIYGIESSSQGLICLYMDTVESILDPTYDPNKFKLLHLGNQLSPVWFVELHSWIRWILKLYENCCSQTWQDEKVKHWLHLIPCFGDALYQDTSIDKLISIIADYLIASREGLCRDPWHLCPYLKRPSVKEELEYVLYYRQHIIWRTYKVFEPNMNSDWNEVFDVEQSAKTTSNSLRRLDENIQCIIREGQIPSVFEYETYLKKLADIKPNHAGEENINTNSIIEETIKLYKAFV